MSSDTKDTIYIYNTRSRKKEPFKPVKDREVSMYICGPTVYNYIHIGNARPVIFFDVARRYFEYLGRKVTYVQNITDIDDKIIAKSIEEGIPWTKVTAKYEKAFFDDCDSLGVKNPDFSPKATEYVGSKDDYVGKMIGLIKSLVDRDYAYEVEGNVFFDVSKYSDYGKLSGKDLTQMEIGERVTEDVQSQKRDPVRDFALWKTAKPGEPFWDSPWGKGRPGWHSECVVMSTKLLGAEFDIHGGGVDLVFPHHENELAQAKCFDRQSGFANYWMHNEFVNIKIKKMAKSEGNVVLVRDLAKKFSKEAIRLFFLQTHYRKPISFDSEHIQSAEAGLEKFRRVISQAEKELETDVSMTEKEININCNKMIFQAEKSAIEAMNVDFMTPVVIREMFEIISIIEQMLLTSAKPEFPGRIYASCRKGLEILNGLNSFMGIIPEIDRTNEDEINILVNKRNDYRKKNDWTSADMVRDQLLEMGIVIEDTADGTRWFKKS